MLCKKEVNCMIKSLNLKLALCFTPSMMVIQWTHCQHPLELTLVNLVKTVMYGMTMPTSKTSLAQQLSNRVKVCH